METLEAIHTRRAIRKFKDKKVPEAFIKKILSAAMHAPSARNKQSWQFIVIIDKETLTKIGEINPNAEMAKNAAVGILICGDLTLQEKEGYSILDCAAATMNLLLAVHDLGLGAVWTGIYPRQERIEGYRKLLNLPEHILPVAFVPIGYPAEKKGKEDRYKQERVHREKW